MEVDGTPSDGRFRCMTRMRDDHLVLVQGAVTAAEVSRMETAVATRIRTVEDEVLVEMTGPIHANGELIVAITRLELQAER